MFMALGLHWSWLLWEFRGEEDSVLPWGDHGGLWENNVRFELDIEGGTRIFFFFKQRGRSRHFRRVKSKGKGETWEEATVFP